MIRDFLRAAILACSAVSLAAGCGSSTPSATVSAIALSPSPCGVTRTNSVQMSAQATLANGSKMDVTSAAGVEWSSGNTNVLTVNPSGVAVGVNPGVTSIEVRYEGASGSLDCTVAP